MKSIKLQIPEDLKSALIEKNTLKVEAIRAVKAAVDKFEKENVESGQEMSSLDYVKALKPLVKQREDSIEKFKMVEGNEELIRIESAEIEVINSYLVQVAPKKLLKEEMEIIAKKYASDNYLGKSDMGKIMSYFKSTYDGQYDGKELSNVAKSVLI